MRHDNVSDVFYVMNNAENIGKQSCVVQASKLAKSILMAVHKAGYIGSFEFIDDGKSGHFRIELIGKINRARSIRPRFAVRRNEYNKWASRYLPAKGFGVLIVSTPKGIMSQKEAEESGLGGRLVGFVY
jgi:small subunit ribosomal protein S8